MIVLHEQTGTVGRMTASNREEITIQPADRFELLQFGTWRFSDEREIYPRHELRFFLTRQAAEAEIRKLSEIVSR